MTTRPTTPRLLPLCALLLACHAATAGEAVAQGAAAQDAAPPDSPVDATSAGPPALTLYNDGFAVVRELLDLDLAAGVNTVRVSGMTSTLEPDSVILRDPAGTRAIRILEQGYRNDPVSQERLLDLFEGRTIRFLVQRGESVSTVEGRIVRSGYVPPTAPRYDRWGNWTGPQGGGSGQPVIEVDGELRFALPGQPLFPSLGDDTVLKPTLGWQLAADAAGPLSAELAYVTGGFSWQANYNVVADEGHDDLDLVGWITMDNRSGKTFRDARIKLLAGDVNKVSPQAGRGGRMEAKSAALGYAMEDAVSEKSFDEFHLYTVARPVTLHDAESKQVEFVRAAGVPGHRRYVYDGASSEVGQVWGADWDYRGDPSYGTQSNRKVWVFREFRNDAASGLGLPLPKGRLRFYSRDSDGQLEFTGENLIDHTPKDEDLRLYVGQSFDLVGERVRTDFHVNQAEDWIDESFRITLRNHKAAPADLHVVEHLYRWSNWELRAKSHDFTRTDSRTIDFPVTVPADGEVVLTYTVHYSW